MKETSSLRLAYSGDSYPTPSWLMGLFKGWFDPCPLNFNPTEDGLNKDWGGRTYVNPPYSKPLPWVKKAIEESKRGKLVVMLLKADTSTEAFRLCHQYGQVLLFARRLKFNGKEAPFGSMLAIFNGEGLNE